MNATLLRVFVAIFTVALGSAWAQESRLPSCPTNSRYWTDCSGVRHDQLYSYFGEFKSNLPHGRGYVLFTDGSMYVGELREDKRHGQGTYVWRNGDRYTGEWADDKQNGLGAYLVSDGRQSLHEWKDALPNGIGIVYNADRSIARSGTWANGKFVRAQGVNPIIFEGVLKQSLPQLKPPEFREAFFKQVGEFRREDELRKSADAERARKEAEAKVRIAQIEERSREQERPRVAEHEAEIKLREVLEETLRIAQQQHQQQQRPVTAPVQQAMNAHALVIGNAAYPGSGRLENPVNDSRAMSAKLRSMGFKVTEVEDANRAKLVTALGQFGRSVATADLSVLFYSGHGVQMSGTNYILPMDINQSDLGQATIQGISLDSAVSQLLPGKTKLVFLDACRDNPLYQVAANKSFNKGLAPISVAEGTLIAYATKDGQVASDGGKGSKNSPFTVALLEHLSDPDDIAVVLRRVREKVKIATGGKQVPWDYGSLTGGALVLSAIKPPEGKK